MCQKWVKDKGGRTSAIWSCSQNRNKGKTGRMEYFASVSSLFRNDLYTFPSLFCISSADVFLGGRKL